MEFLVPITLRLVTVSIMALAMVLFTPVYCQNSTPCSASISSFTPCMNFVTNSITNGTSPITNCCNALKSMLSSGLDCFCLIVTGGVPFQLPFNRTLVISLPRVCNMPGVPLQCKASGAPIPASGPVSFSPTLSPDVSPTASPKTASFDSDTTSPTHAPEPDSSLLTPSSPTTTTTGNRVVFTPSAATPSYRLSPSFVLLSYVLFFMKLY